VEETIARVRLVLETAPGRVPWRKELGCDLDPLAGEPLAREAIQRAQAIVAGAVRRWIPEVEVLACTAQIRVEDMPVGGARSPGLPVAEASLVPFAAHATLDIHLVLQGPSGVLDLDLSLPT
jgi:hypothetical protein